MVKLDRLPAVYISHQPKAKTTGKPVVFQFSSLHQQGNSSVFLQRSCHKGTRFFVIPPLNLLLEDDSLIGNAGYNCLFRISVQRRNDPSKNVVQTIKLSHQMGAARLFIRQSGCSVPASLPVHAMIITGRAIGSRTVLISLDDQVFPVSARSLKRGAVITASSPVVS